MKRYLLGLLFALLASPAFAQLPVCNNGDMIYRGSVGYQCLPFDNTAGKFLQGQGSAAAPIWTFQAPQAFKLPTQSTNTFLGNTTGINASPVPNSVSQILDTIGYDVSRPPVVNSIIYKSNIAPSNTWQALAPAPAAGWSLVSGGLSNPPSWAFINTGAAPGVAGTCLISTGATTSPTYQACLNALNFAVSAPIVVSFATPITTVSCPTCITSASGGAGVALTKTDDTNVTLTLGGSPTTALVNAASLTLGWTGTLALTRGGCAAALTASNGGLLYSTASACAILAGTATANQIPMSGANTAPAWSTATYPPTTAAGTVLTSASANTVTASATPTLGVPGSVIGTLAFANATSGTVTLATPTGALGTVTLFMPNLNDVLVSRTNTDSLTNKTLTSSTNVLGGVTMTLGSDATGDTYYRNSGGVLTRLGIGSTNQALTVSGGIPIWSGVIVTVKKQFFSASGTYTPSAGMAFAVVQCVGAGGGGGGTASSASNVASQGAGGGGGGYSRITLTAATVGASKTVTIGAGGPGGTAGNNAGTAGGDTSLGTLCVGKGGSGGAGNTGSSLPVGGAGGVAGTGDFTILGQAGASGAANGGAVFLPAGYGGSAGLGFGAGAAALVTATSTTGNAGGNYGGGGSGGMTYNIGAAAAGGAGAGGAVHIEEYCTQ